MQTDLNIGRTHIMLVTAYQSLEAPNTTARIGLSYDFVGVSLRENG